MLFTSLRGVTRNHRTGFLMALFFATSVAFAVPPAPKQIHRIYISSRDNSYSADLEESRLASQGLSPIERIESEGKISLYIGKFETNTEAWAYSQELKKLGVLTATPASFENTEKISFTTQFDSNLEPLLIPKTTKFAPLTESRAVILSSEKSTTFNQAMEQGDRELVIASGTTLVEELPDTDPMKARAMIEVGRALVQKEKESAPALPYLLKIAKGDVQACKEDLIEARLMVADSWHYYWFAPLKGYRAYKEISSAHSDDPGVVARCQIEMVACLLEMARLPKAEWRPEFDDVRRACLKLKEEVPTTYTRAHAVADLIYCETYVYEAIDTPPDDLEMLRIALTEFEGFETRHPNEIREISMANHMLGYLYNKLGDWEKSKQYYKKNLTLDLSDPKDNFYWKGERWNLKKKSLQKLQKYAKLMEDTTTEDFCKNALLTEEHLQNIQAETTAFDIAFPHKFYQERKITK